MKFIMKFNISSTFYLNMNFNAHLLKAVEYLKINIDSLVHVLLYVNKNGIFLNINIAITIKTILLFKEDKYKKFLVICINRQTRKQRIKLLNNGESTRLSFLSTSFMAWSKQRRYVKTLFFIYNTT